jgi:hypothetical protein
VLVQAQHARELVVLREMSVIQGREHVVCPAQAAGPILAVRIVAGSLAVHVLRGLHAAGAPAIRARVIVIPAHLPAVPLMLHAELIWGLIIVFRPEYA